MSISPAGCIFIPMPGMFAPKKNPYADKIGDQASSAPLRTGTSDRAAVEKVLGKPEPGSAVGNKPAEYYAYSRNNARWLIIWAFPAGGQWIWGMGEYYSLIIHFAEDGKIQKYELHAQDL
jgi:hypothetical protein